MSERSTGSLPPPPGLADGLGNPPSASPVRPDPRGKGTGRRRPRVGEVGSGTAYSCAADASEARQDRDCGEGQGRDRVGV
jgi:hypothetical protein